MPQPESFIQKDKHRYVCKLKRALYGLKQAPRARYDKLKKALISWGFRNSISDASIFTRSENRDVTLLVVYVDDIDYWKQ